MRCVFFFILSLFTMDAIHAQFSDKRQLLIFGEAQVPLYNSSWPC